MMGTADSIIKLIIKKLWWKVCMTVVLVYCVYLFATTVDAYLVGQVNLWSQNLGM